MFGRLRHVAFNVGCGNAGSGCAIQDRRKAGLGASLLRMFIRLPYDLFVEDDFNFPRFSNYEVTI